MLKNIFRIFRKEARVAMRDGMMLIIIIMPLVLAFGIKLLTPSIVDTSIKIALLESDELDHIEYLENYVELELFSSKDDLEKRVKRSDDIIGYLPSNDGYQIITEGNEGDTLLEFAKLLNVYYENDVTDETSSAEILSLQKDISPLKTQLTNMLVLLIVMLAGMIISLSIVEEKKDNTLNAINVTPVSQLSFIIGKVVLGGFIAMLSIIASLFILGYTDINWFMMLLVGISSMFLTFIVGFLQGLASDDVIEAAAGVKLIILPMAGSIVGYLLLASRWQWTMYWSPFYWTYRANELVLTNSGEWDMVLISVGAVIVITGLVYMLAFPKIRKGLS